jgi:SAM-dependent methyltransferase
MDRQDEFQIDDVYRNMSLDEIPWNMEAAPPPLVELVDSGKVQPCKAIDLGCGAGNYAIYLAGRGFQVTGVDLSPTAIRIAKKNAEAKGAKCDFIVADVIEEPYKLDQSWDFAYDWGLLHHTFPEHRPRYVENVHRILNPKGKYLSACFSEKDTGFGGSGKYRKTRLGSTLYFSDENELKELFESYFEIIDLRAVQISGKFGPRTFNCVFMERK